jgi:hypothetical protein
MAVGFVITAAEIIAFLISKGYHKETGRGRLPAHGRDIRKGTADGILAHAGFTTIDVMDWRNE